MVINITLYKQLNRNWAIHKRHHQAFGEYFVAIDDRDQIVEPIFSGNGYFYIESSPSWKPSPNYIREKSYHSIRKMGSGMHSKIIKKWQAFSKEKWYPGDFRVVRTD